MHASNTSFFWSGYPVVRTIQTAPPSESESETDQSSTQRKQEDRFWGGKKTWSQSKVE